MKKIFFSLIFFLAINSVVFGQLQRALIGIDGLTCSACSYATEKAIRSLDFVKDLAFGLNDNVATITFVPGKQVELDALSRKVRDAAFSVRSMNLIINMKGISVENDFLYMFENMTLHFVKIKPQKIEGEVNLQVLGKNYMSKKAYKAWAKEMNATNKMTGSQKEYYVTF